MVLTEKQEIVTVDPDSIEIGTPGKSGRIKVYGDFRDKEGFKERLRNALELQEYLNDEVEVRFGGE